MTWEPKPGDLGMVVCSDMQERVGFCTGTVHVGTVHDGPVWQFRDGTLRRVDDSLARPLIVIDPADDQRLDAIIKAYGAQPHDMNVAAAMREALCGPPRPHEPEGVGAVVVDRGGDRWVSVHAAESPIDARWRSATPNGGWLSYRDIDAVEILSEGVAAR